MGVCDGVDRDLDSRSRLGFGFHYWSCVEILGKLLIPCCFCSSSMVETKKAKIVITGYCCRKCAAFFPEEIIIIINTVAVLLDICDWRMMLMLLVT